MRTRPWSQAFVIIVAAAVCAACPRAEEAAQKDAAPAEAPPQPGAPLGSQAPEFSIQDEAGNTVALSQHRGKQAVALAFYPMDFTAGWEAELAEFGEKHDMFTAKNVQLYGVSVGTREDHAKFRAQLALPFPLLVDEGAKLSELFDSVIVHEGQKYSARKIVLIDPAGKVAYRDDKYQVGDEADLAALRAAVEAL